MRNKPKFSKILSSQPHLLPWLNFPHNFLYFLFPSNAEEQGMGLWSDTLSLLFLPPLLHGSLPQEAVLQELLQSASFSSGLQFFMNCSSLGPFQCGAAVQEQTAPAWIPLRVTNPASKPSTAPLSTGPQVLPGACYSTGSQTSSGIHLPWGGILHRL